MLILKNRDSYETLDARKRLVDFLSTTIIGCKLSDFAPYKPNEDDDMYWTLDRNNDWKVKFFPDESTHFGIIYRYQCKGNQFEEALAAWLAARISAMPINQSGFQTT